MRRRSLLVGAGAALLLPPAHAQTPPAELQGEWAAMLGALRLELRFAKDGRVVLRNTSQRSPSDIRASVKALDNADIDLRFGSINAMYKGRLVSADRIEGIFDQAGPGPVPLIFARGSVPPQPAAAAPLNQADLDSIRMRSSLAGLAAAAQRRDSAMKLWCSGERARGSGAPVTPGDLWHIGSISKSFTATLVARLVEQGRISWNDQAGDVLNTAAPGMRKEYRPATYRHLLSHRAGLPRDPDVVQNALTKRNNPDRIAGRLNLARNALGLRPVAPMERAFSYSNLGYVVAAAMLEARLSLAWEDLMTEHVFKPMSLASAGFGPPGGASPFDQPYGHSGDKPLEPTLQADNPVEYGPAGRIHISLADLTTYLCAHRDRTALLSERSWTTLHMPPFGGDYAMGWQVKPDGRLGHGGSNGYWTANVLIDTTSGVAAAAACNSGSGAITEHVAARAAVSV